MKRSLLLIIVCCVASLCFSKEKISAPKWLDSPYSQYSSKEYFAAVGVDKNRNMAELKAVEKIAGNFSRDVKSVSKAETHMASRQEGDSFTGATVDSSLNRVILSEIDQEDLIGIELAEAFFDEKHDTWYALALMNKEKTADLYFELVKKNSSAIKLLVASSEKLEPSMRKIAYQYRALKLAQLNESYFPRFFIIHPEKCENAKKLNVSSDSLRLSLDKTAVQVPVEVSVTNDKNAIAETACEELLKSFGIVVNSKNPKYSLNFEINPSYRTVQNPLIYYCEFTISADLKSKSDSKLVPWSFSGRAGGKNEELAKQKAYSLIAEKIKTDYLKVFEEYFYGETE